MVEQEEDPLILEYKEQEILRGEEPFLIEREVSFDWFPMLGGES